MRTVPLQQICDIQIGKTPSRSVPEYWDGELPWATISDFAAGRIVTTTQERITRIGAAKRSGPRNLDSGLSEISIVFQAAVPKPVAPKYTTSGVRRPSEL